MEEVRSGEGYIEAGSGPPIVMLPGMEGSGEFWRRQVETLSSSYRAVSCDLAVRKPSVSSTIADYAADALQKMESLGIDKAVLVGESMGGMITQHIAINHPERVLGIVLCNTTDRPRRGGFGFNVFTLATLANQLALFPLLTDGQRRRLLAWVGRHRGFIMDPTPGNEKLIDYLFAHGLDCGGPSYLDKVIAMSKVRYTESLSSIAVPALIIRGTEDRLFGPETAMELAGRIPRAEIALIDGGGHCCPYTMPEETTGAIRSWLIGSGLES
ncbi:MAG: hypothetical protein CVT63_02950 [Candidatus Anoxymicrobium japonicum]|uniref:AB hydrolase-1 domain-containing protein n=1 Tax=Candidatus Anoxymicrobium japonicum TaxID=2013648 RepID=A0A2N3G6S1_9ACTN|nr:MAG: hypothetical protein CVT63_02950 [Candidatus Anoxymicrobium japonicum]